MTVEAAPPLGALQTTLFGAQPTQVQDLSLLSRSHLDESCWIDVGRDILHGTDELFGALHRHLPWQSFERPMYDRIVAVPRLSTFLEAGDPRFPGVVPVIAHMLSRHYSKLFDRVGANLYRDGQDSVAWHSDRVRRVHRNPIIAVFSLGGSRIFRLRARGGGPSRSVPMHSGDVVVMGGACQHRWEHCVPKVTRAHPRISLTFRHDHPPQNQFESMLGDRNESTDPRLAFRG